MESPASKKSRIDEKGSLEILSKFSQGYQSTRQKNLKCFPTCDAVHMERSFCGVPLEVEVRLPSNLNHNQVMICGEFLSEGATVKDEGSFDLESKSNVIIGKYIHPISESSSRYVINPNRKWTCVVTSPSCVFVVYLIVDGNVITFTKSPAFAVYAHRRSSKNSLSASGKKSSSESVPPTPQPTYFEVPRVSPSSRRSITAPSPAMRSAPLLPSVSVAPNSGPESPASILRSGPMPVASTEMPLGNPHSSVQHQQQQRPKLFTHISYPPPLQVFPSATFSNPNSPNSFKFENISTSLFSPRQANIPFLLSSTSSVDKYRFLSPFGGSPFGTSAGFFSQTPTGGGVRFFELGSNTPTTVPTLSSNSSTQPPNL